jgi:hypothetical protein
MAIHKHLSTLAVEAIDEYLHIARQCAEQLKAGGGIFGYPAALLLLCVVNALGTYLRNEEVVIDGKKQRITEGEPFRVLNHSILNQNLTMTQIKKIERAYRNQLAHAALLEPGAWLTPQATSSPFMFSGDEVAISVPTLRQVVESAWNRFDRDKIKQAVDKFRLGQNAKGKK